MMDDSTEASAAPQTDPVTLSVLDRVLLLSILALSEGDITKQRLVRKEQERVGFTDEENQALGFRNRKDGGMAWKLLAVPDLDFDISVTVRALVRAALKKMGKAEKLTPDHVPLWDQFVGGEEDDEREDDE